MLGANSQSLGIAVLALLLGWSSSTVAESAPYSGNPILVGAICLGGTNENLARAIKALEVAGGRAVRDPETDVHCYNNARPFALRIPEGLEGWAFETLNKAGIRAEYANGTAGGSGDYRIALEPERVFFAKPTGLNLIAIKKDVTCRLRNKFSSFFENVSLDVCPKVSFQDGLCWKVTVSGHTATSRGFNATSLHNKIGDKYWFRTNIEIWMGYFPQYFELDNNLGPRAKIHMSVYSSRFARYPPNRRPEPDQYFAMDHFNSKADVDEIDGLLNDRAADIVWNGTLDCPLAPR